MASDVTPVVAEPTSRSGPSRALPHAAAESLTLVRLAAEALPALGRSMLWIPLGTAALISTLVVAWRHGAATAAPLQAVAIMLSSAAGFSLDDPAAEILAASPTPLLRRRLLRLLLVGPPVAVLWALLMWWQGTEGAEETWALMLLFSGLMGLSLGVAGMACRRAGGLGGIFVPPTIFVLLFLSSAIPGEWRPLPLGDVPGGWGQIYMRWGAAAVLGMVAFLLSSSDPAARRIWNPFGRRP